MDSDESYPMSLNPQILAAVSSKVALFPTVSSRPDDDYPPQIRRSPSQVENSSRKPPLPSQSPLMRGDNVIRNRNCRAVNVKEIGEARLAGLRRQLTHRVVHEDYMPKLGSVKKKIRSSRQPDLPLSTEMLNSLISLCFPGMVQPSSKDSFE